MSYTPTQWQTGDTITAEKLNKMEGGIEAAAVVHIPVKTRNTPGYSSFYIDAADADEVYAALTKANSFVFDIYQIGFDAPLIEIPCKKLVITYTAECVYGNIPHDITMFDGVALPALKADSLYILDNQYQSGSEWTVNNGTMFDTSPLIVTLTPTAQDFSGTMDKTPEEIYNAYMDGRQIRAKMLGVPDQYTDLWAFMTSAVLRYNPDYPEWSGSSYVSVNFEFVLEYGEAYFLVSASTSFATSVYSTTVFPLTPYSP